MKTEMRIITPEEAQELLKLNDGNRNMSKNHLTLLAEDMRRGRWQENGEAIKLSKTKLLDGQHRLKACVLSNTAFKTLVISDLEEDVFYTLDTGKKRTAGDSLKIEGLQNTAVLAAVAKIVRQYEINGIKQKKAISTSEIKETIGRHPMLLEMCASPALGQLKGLISPSIFVAFSYLFSLANPDKADEFIKSLTTGANIDEGNPVYTLRNLLIRNVTAKRRLTTIYIQAYLIQSFNAFAKGSTLKTLRWNTTKNFPKIAGI